jgi:mannose-6-phosphate isomerase-like protein (cupin superfamily)
MTERYICKYHREDGLVDKVWGREEWFVNELEYCFKKLTLKPGFSSSLHYHKKKKETFRVEKGSCKLMVRKRDKELIYSMREGTLMTIQPGQPHRFWLEKEVERPCIIYEVSTHHDDEDVVRLEESKAL